MSFRSPLSIAQPVRLAGLVRLAVLFSTICGLVVPAESVRGSEAAASKVSAIFAGGVPASIADLEAMQKHIQQVTTRVIPCTVAVQVGLAHGSGVIIDPRGFVLTAAHVAGDSGRDATMVLAGGRLVRGKTLGIYRTLDAGLIQITDDPPEGGEWPHAKMGASDQVRPGQWCLATGHPGGFKKGRQPVLRVGRVLSVDENSAITTDCTLIGGDSGGPLFDSQGRVIGVHSRIGGPLDVNLHVPVNAYRQQWNRLTAGEAWGHLPGVRPYIGVRGEADASDAKVAAVMPGTPAARAGLEVGDVIYLFNDKRITDFESLKEAVAAEAPGSQVTVMVQRGTRRVKLQLIIGNYSEP